MSIAVDALWKEDPIMKALASIKRSRTLRNTKTDSACIQERWPCAQSCVGRFIAKIGSQSCWEAIGPARTTYRIVSPFIKQYLDTYSEPTPKWITWSLYMIGNSTETTVPTIIFCCEDESYRKSIRNMVRDSGVLDKYIGISLKHLPRAPDYNQLVQLASNSNGKEKKAFEDEDSWLSRHSVFSTAREPTRGQPLFVRMPDHENSIRKATAGGHIRVSGRYCLLTAGHPFAHTQIKPSALSYPDEDLCFSDSDDGTVSEGSFCSDLSKVNSNGRPSSPGSSTSLDEMVPGTNEDVTLLTEATAHDFQGYMDPEESQSQETRTVQLPENSSHVGDTLFISFEGSHEELDYALIYLKDKAMSFSEDVDLVFPNITHMNNFRHLGYGDVIAHTASAGPVSGTISFTPTYVRAPNATVYQEVYHVSLEKSLANGDCGSWVLDAQSGSLHGHIVAGSADLGFAYIVPASQIFSDIRRNVDTLKKRTLQLASLATSITVDGSSSSAFDSTPPTKVPLDDATLNLDKHVPNSFARTSSAVSPSTQSQKSTQPTSSSGQDSEALDTLAAQLTYQFRGLLSQRRVETLRKIKARAKIPNSGAHDNKTQPMAPDEDHPPSYSSIQNIPLVPMPPTQTRALQFRNMLVGLSNTPLRSENPGLLDEALQLVPLERIYSEAEEESQILIAEAMSLNSVLKPAYGYQDCVARALMRWFKRDFFTWVNNPHCERCFSPTTSVGLATPLPEEAANGAIKVELYQCSHDGCGGYVRFPRYIDPFVLMRTRRGRIGEWSVCFSMFCRAVGCRTRWVWTAEDQVWAEVYSQHRKRWIHIDAAEAAWDKPRLYTLGWGKKLSYCIAFSADGVEDVTPRYVRHARDAAPRTSCSESELLHILDEIRTMRWEKLSKAYRMRLEGERLRERKELRGYVIGGLVADLCSLSLEKLADGSVSIVSEMRSIKGVDDTAELTRSASTATTEPPNRDIH